MEKNGKSVNRKLVRTVIFILVDILIITISFLIFIWIKPASKRVYLPRYLEPFLIFAAAWILVSLIISKFKINEARKLKDIYIPILISNFTILAVITTLIYSFGAFYFSRMIVFGTIGLTTFLELFFSYLYYSYKRPVIVPEFEIEKKVKPKYYPADKSFITERKEDAKFVENRQQIKDIIVRESGDNVFNYIMSQVDVGNPSNLVLSTTTRFNIDQLPQNRFNSLVNLQKINNIRRINKFFESVNQKLPLGGIYIDSAETYTLRKQRILNQYPIVINQIYYFFDFILTRVIPKLPVVKNIYFWVTLGRNRVLSRAETLGRLYSCGFECLDEKFVDGKLYFVVRKTAEPLYPENPTYGLFIRLKRYGKKGKNIGVYKMRTMHAYSEYLQEYVYNKSQLQEGGKFAEDFRVTPSGRFMRKFWLDELPMIFNLLNGDMKLVGVRPLSKQYFNLYSAELKEKRLKFRPGLVPPFYVDLPKTLDQIMASENKYLDAYAKNPIWTDIKYFFKAFWNIVFQRARSN